MNVGDIRYETVTSAKTGETTTIEHIITQADVDEYNAQVAEQDKQDKLNQLEQLKLQVSDMEEAKLKRDGDVLTVEKQSIVTTKENLRAELEAMGETFDCCIDETKLNNNDSTETFFRSIIFDLAKRVKTLENGGV